MKQAIAGVTPSQSEEVTSMVVWPSICSTGLGRTLGRLYSIKIGFSVLTIGNLIALASIPLAAVLYFFRLAPSIFGLTPHGVTYRLTNRRVLEQRNEIRGSSEGLLPKFVFGAETRSVQLDRFDNVKIEVRPGQAWFHAGDLVYYQGEVETFRLPGICRPDVFAVCCMKARDSYVGVQQALDRETIAS